MKNKFFILAIILVTVYSKAQDNSKNGSSQISGIGVPRSTANPNTPVIFENGYLNYTLEKIQLKDSAIAVNELRFHAVSSAMNTKKVMFERFGKWSKEIKPSAERHPILVWEKVKLFDDDVNLYTVYCDGKENWTEMYASVLIFDAQQRDCLNETKADPSRFIAYFSEGIINVNKDKSFEKVYGKTVKSLNKKK